MAGDGETPQAVGRDSEALCGLIPESVAFVMQGGEFGVEVVELPIALIEALFDGVSVVVDGLSAALGLGGALGDGAVSSGENGGDIAESVDDRYDEHGVILGGSRDSAT